MIDRDLLRKAVLARLSSVVDPETGRELCAPVVGTDSHMWQGQDFPAIDHLTSIAKCI